MDRYINAPLSDEDAAGLRAGDYVYITGTIYTARDAAHKRMAEALEKGTALPIDMKHHILHGTIPGKRRPSNWFCRSYHGKQNGQICAGSA